MLLLITTQAYVGITCFIGLFYHFRNIYFFFVLYTVVFNGFACVMEIGFTNFYLTNFKLL
jgi:hypothetical protein